MKRFLAQWRQYFVFGAIFSFFLNLLGLTFPLYMLSLFDHVLQSRSVPTLVAVSIAAALAVITQGALDFIRSRLLVRASVAIDDTLSPDVLRTMLKQAAAPGSDQYAVGLRDVNTVRNFLTGTSIFAIFDMPWSPIYIALVFVLHPLLGWVGLSVAAVSIMLSILSDKVSRKPIEQANHLANAAQRLIGTAVQNSHAIQSMGMLPGVAEQWHKMNRLVVALQTRASKRAGLLQSIVKMLRQSIQMAMYGLGAYLAITNQASAGVMFASSVLMGKGLAPLDILISSLKNFIEARDAYHRLDKLFSAPPEPERMELPEPKGEVRAEAVSLAVGGRTLLHNVSFALAPGESMGLIGPSAAGKSTLAKVLLGIWPPSLGKVRLDGADIASWDSERLGPYLGYLPQDVELFAGTIADNIARLGPKDPDKIIDAAQKAGIHEMVLRMPKGYDTPIGPGGIALSGGQRQRIGLARAMYGNPKFIILDEPNASLDDEGEQALLRALAQLKEQGSTVILITHKASLLASVDKVLFLRDGQLLIFGPRDAVFQKLAEANMVRVQRVQ
ncbi:MAG: type I secretion system permease/ATPase [Desulfomicrobiaceae bacterium]|jgi:PrtD family type I secretion system ABC transporter|nr:type I secretion system permease/ATPase [Desulfomicrobiaceae bacterium]MDI3493090.1 ATP-binding cassette, subfamily type secretion system permease/ATPase [Desulfomicrobiaceae bacterium]